MITTIKRASAVLGVDPANASLTEVKREYRRLLKKEHPDMHDERGGLGEAHDKTVQLREAFQCLSAHLTNDRPRTITEFFDRYHARTRERRREALARWDEKRRLARVKRRQERAEWKARMMTGPVPTLILFLMALWSGQAATVTNVTLAWDSAATATGYRLWQSTGTASFVNIVSLAGTTASVAGVSTNLMTRWYVTATNANGESAASNTVTNQPTVPPPTGTLGISLPVLSSRTALRGATITGQAQFTNGWAVPVLVNEGWLTARQPGASNQSGPFDDWAPGMPSQTVPAGGVVTLTASWVVRADAPFGIWQVHLAVKVDGVYNDGPSTSFTVMDVPVPPPSAPTNLRLNSVTQSRLEVSWDGTLLASTEVWRSDFGNTFRRIGTTSFGALHYSDTSFRRRKDYAYKAKAVNAGGTSGFSNTAEYLAP